MSRLVTHGANFDDPPIVVGKTLTPARGAPRQHNNPEVPFAATDPVSTIPHAVPPDVPMPAGEARRVGYSVAVGADNIANGGYNPLLILGGATAAVWLLSHLAASRQ